VYDGIDRAKVLEAEQYPGKNAKIAEVSAEKIRKH